MPSQGKAFRELLKEENPLQIVGTINAYTAKLAKVAGFRSIYLSGAGVANASYGMPDLAMTSIDNVLEDLRRIQEACDLPILVDADTGWGHALNIHRTIRLLERNGAAGCHIEDQVTAKRCGHRPNKSVVDVSEMVDRIKCAMDAKTDPDFVVMARTDALAVEGLERAIERAEACVEAGADMIFAEAMTDLEQYKQFTARIKVPVLANLTEFGKTPMYTLDELREAGCSMALYPLSAFRAMSKAALQVYRTIRETGSQEPVIKDMQTRDELYEVLDYLKFEAVIDQLNKESK